MTVTKFVRAATWRYHLSYEVEGPPLTDAQQDQLWTDAIHNYHALELIDGTVKGGWYVTPLVGRKAWMWLLEDEEDLDEVTHAVTYHLEVTRQPSAPRKPLDRKTDED